MGRSDVEKLLDTLNSAAKDYIAPMRDEQIAIRYIGGNCPVQAEGTVGRHEFYFRARGDSWSMSIGGADVVGAPDFYHEEDWGDGPYAAGWMPQHVALEMIGKAIGLFLAAERDDEVKAAETQKPPE